MKHINQHSVGFSVSLLEQTDEKDQKTGKHLVFLEIEAHSNPFDSKEQAEQFAGKLKESVKKFFETANKQKGRKPRLRIRIGSDLKSELKRLEKAIGTSRKEIIDTALSSKLLSPLPSEIEESKKPVKTVELDIVLSQDIISRIKEEAKERKITESKLCRILIRQYIEDEKMFNHCPVCKNPIMLSELMPFTGGVCLVNCTNCNQDFAWSDEENRFLG